MYSVWIHFVFIAPFGNKFNVRHFQTEETSRGDPKIILSIMFIDLSYTSPSNIRDIIMRVSQMHYGFKEYRVCVKIIVSFRVQMFFYVTSVWLKSIMSLHQVLFVGFPMRVKQHNLSAYSWPRNPVYYISSVSHFSRLHPYTSDSGIQTRLPS